MAGRALAVDLGLIALVSAALCVFAREPAVMGVIVVAAVALRLFLWSRLPRSERDLGVGGEVAFFGLCTLLGAFNDWNTVVRRGVYAYTVPSELPELSSVPLWMLLFWGFILRALSSLPRWRRLGLGPLPQKRLATRLALIAALVVATRLSIFRFYEHAWLSWLPFAIALVLAWWLLEPGARRMGLAIAVAVAGVAVESLYVRVAGLHAYALGWLGGVPLWIALWWALAALLWGEVSERMMAAFQKASGRST